MSYNEIVKKILDNIIDEINKEENMDRIKKNIIEPIKHKTMYQIYHYVLVFTILFLNIKLCYKE